MRRVGVRELRSSVGKVLDEVIEGGEVVEITRHGRVVARLVPAGEGAELARAEAKGVWAEMDEIAERISARWPAGISAADAVAADRR